MTVISVIPCQQLPGKLDLVVHHKCTWPLALREDRGIALSWPEEAKCPTDNTLAAFQLDLAFLMEDVARSRQKNVAEADCISVKHRKDKEVAPAPSPKLRTTPPTPLVHNNDTASCQRVKVDAKIQAKKQ